jgi:hypothetical protein
MNSAQPRNDVLEHGDLAALICIDDAELQAAVIEQISALGFGIHTALFYEEVAVKLRSHNYELVVVTENFSGADLASNRVLNELAMLPLSQRRIAFVVLIGPTMTSRSEMQAFHYSVDLVLRDDEVGNLQTIVNRGIARHEEFYASFNGALHAVRSA